MLTSLHILLVRKGPGLLRLPLGLVPDAVKRSVIQRLLNWQFCHALAEGELDFLQQRRPGITIADLGLTWVTTFERGALRVIQSDEADVWFRAQANDLLMVAARKADPDTLFFQRRLVIEGNTELGLEVKNVMDAIELDTMPEPLRTGVQQIATLVESGMKQDAKAAQAARAGNAC